MNKACQINTFPLQFHEGLYTALSLCYVCIVKCTSLVEIREGIGSEQKQFENKIFLLKPCHQLTINAYEMLLPQISNVRCTCDTINAIFTVKCTYLT